MKCENCQADVLKIFLFCHTCGKSLRKTERAAETSAVEECPLISKTEKVEKVPTYQEYRKRVSSKRQENIIEKGKKKKTDIPNEVMLNVGRMKLVRGELKPVKGKAMMIRVPVSIRKPELLRKGIDKHAAYDRAFKPFENYALVYPDGTEVLTLPGQPTQLFQLNKYKEDIGKPYNRITLYLVERETLEMSKESDSDYEMEHESASVQTTLRGMHRSQSLSKLQFMSNQSSLPLQVHNDNSPSLVQGANDEASTTEASKPLSVSQPITVTCENNDIQASIKLPSINVAGPVAGTSTDRHLEDREQQFTISTIINEPSTSKATRIQTLREMFPVKGEQEIVAALGITNSLEGAIHLLLNTGNSLNDAYASLLSANADDHCRFTESSDDDFNFSAASETTTFASDVSLQKKLEELKESKLNSEGYLRLKVRRQAIWEDTLLKLNRLQPGELNKPVKVQFIGEPAVDQGGPSREFYSLINSAAQAKLMSATVFRHNISSLHRKEFFAFGQLTALGILQGSPGPKCFSKSLVDYLFCQRIDDLQPTLDEIPNAEVKNFLKNLDTITDAEEFKRVASFDCEFRFEAGYSKPFVCLEDKEEFFQCICLHYTILSSISEIDQFIEGLKTCNLLNLVQENPEMFRKIFQVSRELTAEQVDEVFELEYSPQNSNRFIVEQNIVFNFNQYLEDVEKEKITTQVEGKDVVITLKHVLQFVTGAEDIPAIGFTPHPTIRFSHDLLSKRKMSTNTCANILTIPVANMSVYSNFSEDFTFCMMNSPGFGVI